MSYKKIKDWIIGNTTLANGITLLGIKLCFALLGVIILFRERTITIILLSGAILLTDFFDGVAARYFNSVTKFGAASDRLRDKFFQLTMFVYLLTDPRIDPWVRGSVLPLIIIEIFLLVIWLMELRKKVDVSAGPWGKAKMFLVSIGIIACPLVILAEEHGVKIPYLAPKILMVVFLVSFYLAVMSFTKHLVRYRQQI